MRDKKNNPDLETSNIDGQSTAGGRQRSGSNEKPFRIQGTGKRKGNSSSNGLKNLFTSPFPYLFMAILLTAILIIFGNRDAVQTAPVQAENQLAQAQDGNLQSEIPPAEIQDGNAQAEAPGENLLDGYQPGEPQQEVLTENPLTGEPQQEILTENPLTGEPQQEVLTENPQPGNPDGVPMDNMNGTDAGAGNGQAADRGVLTQNENSQAADRGVLTQNENGQAADRGVLMQNETGTAGDGQAVPADNVNQGGEKDESAGREDDRSVPVESITITAATDVMAQCDTLQLTAAVSPSNADNTALLWFSDDETIARVSQDGLVTSVSAGYTVISAVSSNGIQTDFPITVSSTRKVMTLTVSTECVQNDKVGSKWTYRYLMNGTPVHAVQNMMVEAGKTIRLESEIIEHDEQPDLGSAENNYYVEKSALEDGFEIRQEVYVQENRPKLAGNTASFVVTYRFSDAVE